MNRLGVKLVLSMVSTTLISCSTPESPKQQAINVRIQVDNARGGKIC